LQKNHATQFTQRSQLSISYHRRYINNFCLHSMRINQIRSKVRSIAFCLLNARRWTMHSVCPP
jgi:hypothetical protein